MPVSLRQRMARVAVAFLASSAVVACDPPPPRLVFTVDAAGSAVDAAPGDGVCATATGTCTLQAALMEADTVPQGADVVVPDLDPAIHRVDVRVTRRVRVTAPTTALVGGSIEVAEGAWLTLEGLSLHRLSSAAEYLAEPTIVALDVAGSLHVERSVVGSISVAPTGGVVLQRSVAVAEVPFRNDGSLAAVDSALLVLGPLDGDPSAPIPVLESSGESLLLRSVVASPEVGGVITIGGGFGTCTGPGTVASAGWAHVEVPCAGSTADTSGDAGWSYYLLTTHGVYGWQVSLSPASPLVDAIPVGEAGCEAGVTDALGRERGVDGNGDGIAGCDVGPLEVPAVVAA